ncbi:MAG: DUF1611 domain-containing protein [Pirellulales bacterium]
MTRKIVILTEGHTNPHTAKTAASVIRYRTDEVVAVLDSTQRGVTSQALLGVGGGIPVVGSLEEAPSADTLLIGIAPRGGRIPDAWRPVILKAITRGMNIVSGLHDFISDDAEFAEAARQRGVTIHDVRKNRERDIAQRPGFRQGCVRIHTVGHDCSVGKMVTAIELQRGLSAAGHNAKFVATGQTGIMIEGDGCPLDCVVSDFINGAAEKLVLANQQHDFLLIEGQGSLFHPSYSAVTLGILHGTLPDGLVLCYEAGRTQVAAMEHVPLPSLTELRRIYETVAGIMHPCRAIGIAVNSRRLSATEADDECHRASDELGLPACDVFRHGADVLVQAVLRLREEIVR